MVFSIKAFPAMPHDHASFSFGLFLSYIFDWILIVGIALIGYGFHKVEPNHMPFSLDDPAISYPYRGEDTVRTSVLVVVSLIVPAILIAFLSLIFTPGASLGETSRALSLRRKIWEWNAGWLGLGLACAGVFMATEGLKDLYGKPRPDMLARCDPDLSNIGAYAVGGLGQRLQGAPTLVTWEICQNRDDDVLRYDAFTSFPSGHASFSFAGLTYFSLWLCSKFSIKFPYLSPSPLAQDLRPHNRFAIRNHGAAPPIYLVILAFFPWAVAFFIAASRWFDYVHAGFDIISGSLMGFVFGWVGFRLYSPPISRGTGWSWGARSRDHAFFKGVGVPSNVGDDNWASPKTVYAPQTVENGHEYGHGNVDLESGRRDLAE
ncbi:PAP2 superfamily-domain-containing protein [Aspergillus egyptiacus]|nr:PAP2 superfamily-domain-containing protein [Aspergillus egyptiacus]